MKGMQAISVTLFMSFLVLVTRGKDVQYKRQEEDTTQILSYHRVNKTIVMKDGDVYDCVDVNEQPAFRHPLLKDHKVQMQPNYFPVWMDIQTLPSDEPSIIECPMGTIPILHTNGSDTIAAHSYDGQLESAGLIYQGDVYGVRGVFNVWEPKVNKYSKDSSAMCVEMKSGGEQHTDRIGAGVRVFPTLSGDTFVRFHISWYDGLYKKSCIDFSCPGFVQVSHRVGLGARMRSPSVYHGKQTVIHIQIFKDPVSKNWWLTYEHVAIGYWPSALFEFLRNKGDAAFWGGIVEGPTASSNSPQMGSGHFASEGYRGAAFVKNIQIANNEKGYFDTPDKSQVRPESSDKSKYTVERFEYSKYVGMRIFYGGLGSYKAY
ncbi:unnamed protein product [Triticum turgidum subsp. durum]|uniref:Neprosin PEP catalytic domain-containing protein n=1 Tax=Triticum turgidum subsp. durum TaxID=4567 RepID=A0A9R0YCH7_TRITD|nr:unnamed protein product [Triticum turgidum subsp. durum]